MNTNSEQLISAKVGWRMRQTAFDAAFPQPVQPDRWW